MRNKPDQSTRRALNLFFMLFLAIGALLAGSAALFYRAEINTYLSQLKEQERQAIARQLTAIEGELDDIDGDLLFLSRQNELHNYLETGDDQALQAMKAEYIALSTAKKVYDQARYLDSDGREVVRVNCDGEKYKAIPDEKLQDKSNRYYFKDTFELDEGEIFVSPLDLNVEQGKIERPFKPMIRFGTPIFDNQGKKRGIVLLNYLAGNMLELIEAERIDVPHSNMLLNMEGYWLLHPDKEKEWGFMFEDRADISFAGFYPKEWQTILEQQSGQLQTENGLFTFRAIHPLHAGEKSSNGSGRPKGASAKTLDGGKYFWILVSHIPNDVMNDQTMSVLRRLFLYGAGLFVVIAFGAWQLALAITKRRIYQARLVEMALFDSLTGLPNRKYFFDKLEDSINNASRYKRMLGLLYIDLDGFKGINDTMGHDAGDELLVKVGARLKSVLRKADTVARLGGDEFAVILSEIKKPDDAILVGKKIVDTVCDKFELKTGAANIGASVGAAVYPDHEDTVDALVKRADAAMYQAKAKGKNTCVSADSVKLSDSQEE